MSTKSGVSLRKALNVIQLYGMSVGKVRLGLKDIFTREVTISSIMYGSVHF